MKFMCEKVEKENQKTERKKQKEIKDAEKDDWCH